MNCYAHLTGDRMQTASFFQGHAWKLFVSFFSLEPSIDTFPTGMLNKLCINTIPTNYCDHVSNPQTLVAELHSLQPTLQRGESMQISSKQLARLVQHQLQPRMAIITFIKFAARATIRSAVGTEGQVLLAYASIYILSTHGDAGKRYE